MGEPGWIATDNDQLDLIKTDQWESLFARDSLEAILAEHVWEHLSLEEGLASARLCYQYLKPGGYIRAAVPDGYHPDPSYIDHVKVGGNGPGASNHQVLYNHVTFRQVFEQAGFEVDLLEYFDSAGVFHCKEWDVAMGKVYRSRRFDSRNTASVSRYTSIVLDAHKR
jgi:predicted SAM-dependent methyltransferase